MHLVSISWFSVTIDASYGNTAAVVSMVLWVQVLISYTFGDSGAYAAAVVNNSFKPLTAQAWYYNVSNVADAYWLQADIDCSLVKGVKIGAQYADMDPKGVVDAGLVLLMLNDSSAYAFKLGYEGVENLKVSAAYSDVDEDGALKIANVATNNLGGAQSKLYTEAWWNYGYVGAPGAESYNLLLNMMQRDCKIWCILYRCRSMTLMLRR